MALSEDELNRALVGATVDQVQAMSDAAIAWRARVRHRLIERGDHMATRPQNFWYLTGWPGARSTAKRLGLLP